MTIKSSRLRAMTGYQRLLLAIWGGVLGSGIAAILCGFLPGQFVSTITLELKKAPDWLETERVSMAQAVELFRTDDLLVETANALGIQGDQELSTLGRMRGMIQARAVSNTHLIIVSATATKPDDLADILTTLADRAEELLSTDYKSRAVSDLKKEYDANKDNLERLKIVESEIKRLMPDYFEKPRTDCLSGSDEENAEFTARLRAYENEKNEVEKSNPEFLSLLGELGELNRICYSKGGQFWIVTPIPYLSLSVIEDASIPERVGDPRSRSLMLSGGAFGFFLTWLFGPFLFSKIARLHEK